MKVVADAETRKILGAAILGTGGDEAIHGVIDIMNADATLRRPALGGAHPSDGLRAHSQRCSSTSSLRDRKRSADSRPRPGIDHATTSIPEGIHAGGGRRRRRSAWRPCDGIAGQLEVRLAAPSRWIRSRCSSCRRISTCSSWSRWARPMVPSKRPGITLRDRVARGCRGGHTRSSAPPMMRWGGIFADFYRWREGVGPRDARPAMLNLLWGGIESNQVGTGEFVDFCRRAGADPLICVNFESDGRKQYMKVKDSVRTADAREAAEWVAYCNDPDNRRAQGARARRAAGTSGTGRSGTRPPTTRMASISKPRRARPSSSRRPCGRPIPRFS